ncbi:MAG: cobyric acid synthase [Acidobacteriota bacterium]|nr:cobyric acid synthase [Acidobacteriota bacterium]
MARALMVLGTASHVGKSVITAGLCRILADRGLRVAPFKAQNMSLNSAATPDGLEIGRAQALQAEACRIAPRAEMNPVLIKPSSDTGSQVILLGKVWGQVTASDYHLRRVEELFPAVLDSYRKLAAEYEVIVLEGAGSPAEINLRDHDIVNMRMAKAANAACLLIGDIDRGGVFASLAGTMQLLEPEERATIRGFAVNKFRGDESLLRSGLSAIEDRIGLPCVGVIPMLRDLGLDEEDSVAIEDRRAASRIWNRNALHDRDRPLRIGVIALPHLSNFTDFDALAAEPSIALAYLETAEDALSADLLIIPGSKQTLDDLDWLHRTGFAPEILKHRERAGSIMGICGGLQMLGGQIEDPHGIENGGVSRTGEGLQLLGIHTVLDQEKTTRPITGSAHDVPFRGYEIHVGKTTYLPGTHPFAVTESGLDGAISIDGRVFGTYVHGIFDDDTFRHRFIDDVRRACGLTPAREKEFVTARREEKIDRWAAHLSRSLDIDQILSWI